MNEALKIGLGITMGFALLGFLIFTFVYLSTGQEALFETNNLVLSQQTGQDTYIALIKNNPGEAREEVYIWMKQELGLNQEEACNTSVIFRFSDDIGDEERNNFSPAFNACAP